MKNLFARLFYQGTEFSHKGHFGHALIIAGKLGSIGAALLAVKACYRSGAGLVTSCIPRCGVDILQAGIPEAMVMPDELFDKISSIPSLDKYTSIGIGPGLDEGYISEQLIQDLFSQYSKPIVIDAGALNVISRNIKLLESIPAKSILTPHVKEFERIVGHSETDIERIEKLLNLAQKIKCIVILKGAHTAIAMPNGEIYFNSTGNPGMATGGSGDVLTGIITGLLAQGYKSEHAAILGVYLHGYAGDKASKKTGMAPLLASDIIEGMKPFFLQFEKNQNSAF